MRPAVAVLRRPAVVDLLTAGVLTVLVLGPMVFRRGYVLRGDMVFVPDQPWKPAWLGLDGGVPRSVPTDALVWLLGTALPGDLVQLTLLAGLLVLGGWGAARLVGSLPAVARCAAAVVYVWNPYTYERLGIGQWSLLGSYLLLPWVVIAARRYRVDGRFTLLVVTLAGAAVLSPPGGLLAGLVALVVLAGAPWRRTAFAAGLALLANLPWLVPALLVRGGLPREGAGVPAFAATGESSLGAVASLLGLGGIWKQSVQAPERANELVVLASLVVVALCLLGLRFVEDRVLVHRVLVAGLAGLVVAAVPTLNLGAEAVQWVVAHVPGAAIARDSHRYVAPWGLALSVGAAGLVTGLTRMADRGEPALRALGVMVCVAPLALLPSLAWGQLGDLEPVSYPAEWEQVRETWARVDHAGALVVLPWEGSYRRFAWNDRRAQLDPAPRYFPGDVLIDDRVLLGEATLPSEDLRMRRVAQALASTDPVAGLTRLGVSHVLVEKQNAGAETHWERPVTVLHDGPGLRLVALPVAGAAGAGHNGGGSVHIAVLVTDITWLAGMLCLIGIGYRRRPV